MNPRISLDELSNNILSRGDKLLSSSTLNRHFKEKDMKKWMHASWIELEAKDVRKQLAFAIEHRNLSIDDWLYWIWSDGMYVRGVAGGSRSQIWVL